MIGDVYIQETNNGGDLMLVGQDLFMVSGWENMVYTGLFGGNVEQSTGERATGEQFFDWWGNALLMPDQPEIQFNSATERRLMNVALNSNGRLLVEDAIRLDLEFMKPFAEITVRTAITAPDRLEIRIGIRKPEQLEEQTYIYLWDGLQQTLQTVSSPSGYFPDFNDDFNDDFNS